MNSDRWAAEKIFLYRDPVDMRKQIDGLAGILISELGRNPADRSVSAESGKRCMASMASCLENP